MSGLTLLREQSFLLVIDVQEKLVAAVAEAHRARAVDNVARLVRGAGALGVPVLVTEQYPQGLGRTVPAVAAALAELPAPATTLEKTEFDACRNPGVTERLRAELGRRSVVVCGMEAHICVWQTARGLRLGGYSVHVPVDATASRDPENRRVAEGLWREAGALVTSSEAVLFDWVGGAGSAEFKAISRLVR